jgi:osmotically-inducible protein OsmY
MPGQDVIQRARRDAEEGKSLDHAEFKDVSVSQGRDKGMVTLTGTVPTETDKDQVESIAKSNAANLVDKQPVWRLI